MELNNKVKNIIYMNRKHVNYNATVGLKEQLILSQIIKLHLGSDLVASSSVPFSASFFFFVVVYLLLPDEDTKCRQC